MKVIIHYSPEDKAYIAEIPELPGCMADGQTKSEALQNVATIAKEWLDTTTELGRKIPEN